MEFQHFGVPGASTFNIAMVDKVRELPLIFIHHEKDRGGDEFVKNICKKLVEGEYKGSVYVIECMTQGVKDPSELHIKHTTNFDEMWVNIVNAAEEINPKVKMQEVDTGIEGAPVKLRIPLGWNVTKEGISMQMPKDMEYKLICKTPILFSSRLKSIESGEEKMEIVV